MCNKYVIPIIFLRAADPRFKNKDYTIHFTEQIKLRNKYNLPFNCLLTYDAMENEKMINLVKENKNQLTECGLWFELCGELARKAGIEWRGKEEWEWFVNPGFLMAYTSEEKKKIIDIVMEKYFSIFNEYPKTIAAWLLDSWSMDYITEKYSPNAFAICREQWGMDAYTLWGGPYYGGYYPSKNNALVPAQNKSEQINTPVFRMYTNDPLYCYYEHEREKYNKIDYHLFTQEPFWMCGQNPNWVKWHYDNLFTNNSSGFAYTELGQENGFGWNEKLENALKYQYEFAFAERQKYGFEYTTFGEMGKKFKKEYQTTPITYSYALSDWADKGNKSIWFNSKYYRINVFSDNKKVWIRDIQKYDETQKDPYLDSPCLNKDGVYDALPIMDGVQFSGDTVKAGIYFGEGTICSVNKENDRTVIEIIADGKKIQLFLKEESVEIVSESTIKADFVYKNNCDFIKEISSANISYKHHSGKEYNLTLTEGYFEENKIFSKNNKIVMNLS